MSQSELPLLRTSLPGPKAARLIERDQAVLSPSYTRGYPLMVDRGEGAMVYRTRLFGHTFVQAAIA